MIQYVTFLSPNVGGHQQPLKGSLKHPKNVNKKLPGSQSFWGKTFKTWPNKIDTHNSTTHLFLFKQPLVKQYTSLHVNVSENHDKLQHTWMPRWKLGSMVSKWVISPTFKWGNNWGEIIYWSDHHWSDHFLDIQVHPLNLGGFMIQSLSCPHMFLNSGFGEKISPKVLLNIPSKLQIDDDSIIGKMVGKPLGWRAPSCLTPPRSPLRYVSVSNLLLFGWNNSLILSTSRTSNRTPYIQVTTFPACWAL